MTSAARSSRRCCCGCDSRCRRGRSRGRGVRAGRTLMPYDGLDEAIDARAARRGQPGRVARSRYDARRRARAGAGIAPYHGRISDRRPRLRAASRPATARRCPRSCTAVRAGPAAARSWAACAACSTTCSARPCRVRRRALTALTRRWTRGAAQIDDPSIRSAGRFEELDVGETSTRPSATITLEDIEHFAAFHRRHVLRPHGRGGGRAPTRSFGGRVAHGYLLLSFAAGLFVDPAPGPVLANYGLDNLRFLKPVKPGDAIRVRLTCKQKTPRRGRNTAKCAGTSRSAIRTTRRSRPTSCSR